MPQSNKLKLICWNVNGLRSVKRKGFDNFMSRYRPDVACIQEVKVGRRDIDSLDLDTNKYGSNYALAKKPGYSGVATLVREGSDCTGHKIISKPKYDDEGRYLISKLGKYTLYNIYFPSGSSGEVRQEFKMKFLKDFLSYLKKKPASELNKTIICGDFNICHKEVDIHHPKQAERLELSGFLPEEREWMDKLEALGFKDAFREKHPNKTGKYSWWSYRAGARQKNLGWRIDYFWVAEPLAKKITRAEILSDITGSDHAPLLLELQP